MLMPSLFGENLLDEFFGMPRTSRRNDFETGTAVLMGTDVKEKEDGYEIDMNLPGVKKEDVQAELKDGYLKVKATTDTSKETKNEDGKYIRRERYSGTCSRSFYVGEQVTQEDIKAKFKDGVLTILVPKKEAEPKVEEKKYIAIEE